MRTRDTDIIANVAVYLAMVVVVWAAWQHVAVKAFDAPPLSFGQALLATTAVAIIAGFIGVFGKVDV